MSKSLRRGFDRLELQRTRRRIPQHCDAGGRRNGFDQHLQALCAEIGKIQEHARDVAARARKAGDQTAGHRIAFKVDRDYGNAARGAARRLHGRRACRQDGVDLLIDQVRRERRQARQISVGETDGHLDAGIAPVVRFAQALAHCRNACGHDRGLPGMQQPDLTGSPRLLRACCDRPAGHRAADSQDELPSPHSITSSAAARSVGGTVRPSILAVCALTTSSSFVACTTGRFVGFSPLRMRPA